MVVVGATPRLVLGKRESPVETGLTVGLVVVGGREVATEREGGDGGLEEGGEGGETPRHGSRVGPTVHRDDRTRTRSPLVSHESSHSGPTLP